MEFLIQTTEGPYRYPADCRGQWTFLFYYGGDFQPVSATELLELAALQEEFFAGGCRILCLSQDSIAVHLAFLETLSRYRIKPQTPIHFALGTDSNGALRAQMGLAKEQKYLWLLSPDGAPRAHFSYPNEIGANFTEVLRALLALKTRRPTPCGWVPGACNLLPPPVTRQESIGNMQRQEQAGHLCIDWYLCFSDQ